MPAQKLLSPIPKLIFNLSKRCTANLAINVDQFDGRSSFYGKSTSDVARGLLLLKLATFGSFVENSEKLYKFSEKILGEKISEKILEKSFYAQFVAGDGKETLEKASDRLLKYGNVKCMLCPPMEDLEGSNKNFDKIAKENTDKFLDHLNMAHELNKNQNGQKSVMQYKLSAAFPIENFDHFSGIIDQRNEGWEKAVRIFIDALKSGNISGLADLGVDEETQKWFQIGLEITKVIFEKAQKLQIPILIDAELKSSHSAMFILTLALAALYNKPSASKPLVYGTYQCYFKETRNNLKQSLDICKKLGVICGAKLVRGAYMLQERRIAAENNLPDPIWATYDETSKSYNGAVEMLLNCVASGHHDVSFFVASHNKDTVQKAVNLMDNLRIPKDHPAIRFAQIYGMCDHISFGLGQSGYTVYKSVPWGSVSEWVPYLARRAAENHTAFKTARNEIPLYKAELKRRIFGKSG